MYFKTYNLATDSIPKEVIDWCLRNNYSSGRVADHDIPLVNGKYEFDPDCGFLYSDLKSCISEKRGTIAIAHTGNNELLLKKYLTPKQFARQTKPKILAWALIQKVSVRGVSHNYQCYVLPSQRRKGIAKKLLYKVFDSYAPLKVCMHYNSTDFYLGVGAHPKSEIIRSLK